MVFLGDDGQVSPVALLIKVSDRLTGLGEERRRRKVDQVVTQIRWDGKIFSVRTSQRNGGISEVLCVFSGLLTRGPGQ